MLVFICVWRHYCISQRESFSNTQHSFDYFLKCLMVSLFFLHLENDSVRHLVTAREVDAVATISLLAKGGFFIAA